MLCRKPRAWDGKTIVPCGWCIACRINRAKEWEVRCLAEGIQSTNNYFVTFTYNDMYLPDYFNGIPQLYLPDTQDLFKVMRNSIPFKYYNVGEYGGKLQRPHYHTLFFVKEETKINKFLELCYYSWLKGIVQIYDMDLGLIRYCTRYVIEKDSRFDDLCEHTHVRKQFQKMSLRPALGLNYFKEQNEKYGDKMIKDMSIKINEKTRLPRYYKKKLKEQYPDTYEEAAVKVFKELTSKPIKKYEQLLEENRYVEMNDNFLARIKG